MRIRIGGPSSARTCIYTFVKKFINCEIKSGKHEVGGTRPATVFLVFFFSFLFSPFSFSIFRFRAKRAAHARPSFFWPQTTSVAYFYPIIMRERVRLRIFFLFLFFPPVSPRRRDSYFYIKTFSGAREKRVVQCVPLVFQTRVTFKHDCPLPRDARARRRCDSTG